MPELTGENRDDKGRFMPGVSGNPTGRPPDTFSIIGIIKNKLQEIPKSYKKSYAELIVDRILLGAIKGDARMIKMVLEYVDGKPIINEHKEDSPLLILDM